MSPERPVVQSEQKHSGHHPELAWTPDLIEAFGVANAAGRLEHFHPVEPDPDAEFIDAPAIVAHVISGGRGTGKSTLLYYRARYLREQKRIAFVRDVPPHGFFLRAGSLPIPKETLVAYATIEPWLAAWQLVLGMVFAFSIKRRAHSKHSSWKLEDWYQTFRADSDEPLLQSMVARLYLWGQNPHQECIEQLLAAIFQSRAPTAMLNKLFVDRVEPMLATAVPDVSTWVLFVDRIDEALADHESLGALLGVNLPAAYVDNEKVTQENVSDFAQHVWRCSQAAYCIAAHQLRSRSNGQLVALGTIRAEAYPTFLANCGLTKTKVESFVLALSMDEDRDNDLMRSIFRLNVGLMGTFDLCKFDPNQTDPGIVANEGLVGYRDLYSRSVFGFHETPYDYLRRHSFGTPRGLMTLGRSAAKVRMSPWAGMEPMNWRSPAQVIRAVNRAAVDVFEEYRDNLFPRWDKQYEAGFVHLHSNILGYDEIYKDGGIEDLFRRVTRGVKNESLIGYLFRAGLLGIPTRSGQTKTGWVQSFSAPGHSEMVLPTRFAYAVLHPAFAAYLVARVPRETGSIFYSSQLVACPNGPCPEALPRTTLRLNFRPNSNSATVSCSGLSATGEWKELFSKAEVIGPAFIAVLAVAHRLNGGGHLTVHHLQDVAHRLSELGYIPKRLGKSPIARTAFGKAGEPGKTTKETTPTRKSPHEWIQHVCDQYADAESHTVTSAKDGFLQMVGLTIDAVESEDGKRFCLAKKSDTTIRLLEPEEVLIEGLSIDAYFGAVPGKHPQ